MASWDGSVEVPAIPKLSEFKLDAKALKNKKNKPSILDDYPDYPKRDKNISNEEHQKIVREYFKAKGLNHIADFSEGQIKQIIEENTMNLIGCGHCELTGHLGRKEGAP